MFASNNFHFLSAAPQAVSSSAPRPEARRACPPSKLCKGTDRLSQNPPASSSNNKWYGQMMISFMKYHQLSQMEIHGIKSHSQWYFMGFPIWPGHRLEAHPYDNIEHLTTLWMASDNPILRRQKQKQSSSLPEVQARLLLLLSKSGPPPGSPVAKGCKRLFLECIEEIWRIPREIQMICTYS